MSRKTVLFISLCIIGGLFPVLSPSAQESPAELPPGFRNIELGMSMKQVKDLLLEDPYFKYRGDPDVSMLLQPNQSLIECEGYSFISRAYFHFYEDRLYIMTLSLNPEEIDYYTMYTSLKRKYGEESRLSPDDVVWENGRIRLSLERPLSVKYIDSVLFGKLKEAGRARESLEEISRDRFIDQF